MDLKLKTAPTPAPGPAQCPLKLTVVNLLGDEMEVFSTCELESGSSPKTFTLSSHGKPKEGGSVHLFYEQQKDTDARSYFILNVRKANTNSSARGIIHGISRPSPVEMRTRKHLHAQNYGYGHSWSHWNTFRIVPNTFLLMSPKFHNIMDEDKLVCKLTYQPAPGENDSNINFRIFVEFMRIRPVCGYKLSLVNMLGDILEAHTYCDDTDHNYHPYYKPEFTALGNPQKNGSVWIVFEKVKESATASYCLYINVLNGPAPSPLAQGNVNVSCLTWCITPNINNGYFDCTTGNNGERTCIVKCVDGCSFQSEFDAEYTCQGTNWNPSIKSAFQSNACKCDFCSPPTIANGSLTCSGSSHQFTCGKLECDEGYEVNVQYRDHLNATGKYPLICSGREWQSHINSTDLRIMQHYLCITEAEPEGADKVILPGQTIPASGIETTSPEQHKIPMWITAGSGVSVGVMVIVGILILYVVRHRKPKSHRPQSEDPPLTAKESAVTPKSAA